MSEQLENLKQEYKKMCNLRWDTSIEKSKAMKQIQNAFDGDSYMHFECQPTVTNKEKILVEFCTTAGTVHLCEFNKHLDEYIRCYEEDKRINDICNKINGQIEQKAKEIIRELKLV